MERNERPTRGKAQDILVVDPDPEYAVFVGGVLDRAGFVGHHLSSGETAVTVARKLRPAAVLLDVIVPGTTGYEICRELRLVCGDDLPIVFASAERREPADRVVGLLIGADDYLVKPVDPDELVARLRRLIAKSSRLPGAISAPPSVGGLTTRETEVLRLLARGLDQAAIARELGISPATVGTHIQRILTKLGVHSRTQAVALAYRERLVDHI